MIPETKAALHLQKTGWADFVPPMTAVAVQQLPEGKEWVYEMKFDGYRCIASKRRSRVRLFSRRGNSFNGRFPEIARALESIEPGTILDGEIVAIDDHGRPSFQLLQNRHRRALIYFYAFDVLAYAGRNLLNAPLAERKTMLDAVVQRVDDPVRLSLPFPANPAVVLRAKELEMEGIIAKRLESLYKPGERSGGWQKYKINQSDEFVVGGYTPGHPFDALIVGRYEGGKLIFVNKVRAGFVPRIRAEVFRKLKGLASESCPFANLPEKKRTVNAITKEEMKNCRWLEPEVVAQIEFASWTRDGHLREAKFVGLREDKNARDVVKGS